MEDKIMSIITALTGLLLIGIGIWHYKNIQLPLVPRLTVLLIYVAGVIIVEYLAYKLWPKRNE